MSDLFREKVGGPEVYRLKDLVWEWATDRPEFTSLIIAGLLSAISDASTNTSVLSADSSLGLVFSKLSELVALRWPLEAQATLRCRVRGGSLGQAIRDEMDKLDGPGLALTGVLGAFARPFILDRDLDRLSEGPTRLWPNFPGLAMRGIGNSLSAPPTSDPASS